MAQPSGQGLDLFYPGIKTAVLRWTKARNITATLNLIASFQSSPAPAY